MERSVLKLCRTLQPAYRCMSTTKLTTVDVNDKGIATVAMNRPPVNGLNLELLNDLKNSFEEVEENKCRGLILTSSSKSVYSAGLDIMELYKPDQERFQSFWTALQDCWLTLYGCGVPTAAAINGHSPAGGCLLASSCEYRVMLPNFTIGLNETKVGIPVPTWVMASFSNVLPRRTAEMALTQGELFSTEEALKAGLIDAIANDKGEAIAKCEEFIGTFSKVNPFARALTKQQFRMNDMKKLQDEKEADTKYFFFVISRPDVQKGIQLYLESLKSKSKSK